MTGDRRPDSTLRPGPSDGAQGLTVSLAAAGSPRPEPLGTAWVPGSASGLPLDSGCLGDLPLLPQTAASLSGRVRERQREWLLADAALLLSSAHLRRPDRRHVRSAHPPRTLLAAAPCSKPTHSPLLYCPGCVPSLLMLDFFPSHRVRYQVLVTYVTGISSGGIAYV